MKTCIQPQGYYMGSATYLGTNQFTLNNKVNYFE